MVLKWGAMTGLYKNAWGAQLAFLTLPLSFIHSSYKYECSTGWVRGGSNPNADLHPFCVMVHNIFIDVIFDLRYLVHIAEKI